MAEPAVLHFGAMGSPGRVVVDHDRAQTAEAVRDLIQSLERKWSRFLPTSEISALNRALGTVTIVSEQTYALIGTAVRACEATGGMFNPLMLRQLETHGYRRSWTEAGPTPIDRPVLPASDDEIVLYPEISAVRLPEGTGFDPGGIGKGLAIDMAIELCMSSGSATGCVELGGDLRVYGPPWYGPQWTIAVADPFDAGVDIATFTPGFGAITTSTTRKRRWCGNGRTYHHLLDPATGWPGVTDVVSVTTCSEQAWWAEVVAKSALLAGSARGPALLDHYGIPGAIVTETGRIITTGSGCPIGGGR